MRFILLTATLAFLSSCDMLMEDNGGGTTTNTTTITKPNTTTDNPVISTKTKLGDFLPTQKRGDELVEHTYYTLSYSSKFKNPEWTAYELTADKVNGSSVERSSHSFHDDPETEADAANSDYNNSGYDRGHLVPASDMSFNEKAMEESFFMTNVSPQDPTLNRGIWKSLEDKVRKWAVEYKRIYVVSGPILPGRATSTLSYIGANEDVLVPGFYYKVILDYEGKDKKGIAFVFKNEASSNKLSAHATTISKIEEKTGVDFFPNLTAAEQASLEQVMDVSLWNGLE